MTGPTGSTGFAGTPAYQPKLASLQNDVSSPKGAVTALQSQNASTTGNVTTPESLLTGITRTGNTLLRSGMKLQLETAPAASTAPRTGWGSLIVGHDENPATQTGSANLVLGEQQSFTSYGGFAKTIRGRYASVTGGHFDVASDSSSSVAGGCDNGAGHGPVPFGPCSDQAEAILGGASAWPRRLKPPCPRSGERCQRLDRNPLRRLRECSERTRVLDQRRPWTPTGERGFRAGRGRRGLGHPDAMTWLGEVAPWQPRRENALIPGQKGTFGLKRGGAHADHGRR